MTDLKISTPEEAEMMKERVFLDLDLRQNNILAVRACVRTQTGTVVVGQIEVPLTVQTAMSINERGGPQ